MPTVKAIYEIDKGMAAEVEHHLAPPVRQLVSLPVKRNGMDVGLVIYVASSEFAAVTVTDSLLVDIAEKIQIVW